MEQLFKRKESGFSLISMMMTVGIMGILAVGFSRMMSNNIRASKKIEVDIDREAIKRMVFTKVSCSVSAATCPDTAFKNLRDIHGNIVISQAGTRYGHWTLRAECGGTGGADIVVRAARLASGGTVTSVADAHFIRDPLTRKITKWTDDDALLFGNTVLCSATAPSVIHQKGYIYKANLGCGLIPTVPGCQRWTWGGLVTCPTGYRAISGGFEWNTNLFNTTRCNGTGCTTSPCCNTCGGSVVNYGPNGSDTRSLFLTYCMYSHSSVPQGVNYPNLANAYCIKETP